MWIKTTGVREALRDGNAIKFLIVAPDGASANKKANRKLADAYSDLPDLLVSTTLCKSHVTISHLALISSLLHSISTILQL